MSKPPLKDVQENIANMRPCPNCSRTPGLYDTPANQMGPLPNGWHSGGPYKGYRRSGMPACRFCQGLKFIYPNRICACGYPAVRWDEKALLWSCGDVACISSEKWRKEHPYPSQNQLKDWYGHGGFGS